MICKFFPTGIGETRKATDYLQHDGARVIKGNLELTRQISESIKRKRKYTSGVLSFTESNLDFDIKMSIICDFERIVFPGFKPENYNITWVEHHDKNRLELHFISPRIELKSGHDYAHYLHKLNLKKMNKWKDLINVKYDLTNPYDEDNLLFVKPAPRNNKYKKIIDDIGETIVEGVKQRTICCRSDVLECLATFKDIQINLLSNSHISIRFRNDEKGGSVLKGKVYEAEFLGIDKLLEDAKKDAVLHIQDVRDHFETHLNKLEELLQKQKEKNIAKYRIVEESNIVIENDPDFIQLFSSVDTHIQHIGEFNDSARDKINEYIRSFDTFAKSRDDSIERIVKYTYQTKQRIVSSKSEIFGDTKHIRRNGYFRSIEKFISGFSNIFYQNIGNISSEVIRRNRKITLPSSSDDEFDDLFQIMYEPDDNFGGFKR